jgi:hypothetical protein
VAEDKIEELFSPVLYMYFMTWNLNNKELSSTFQATKGPLPNGLIGSWQTGYHTELTQAVVILWSISLSLPPWQQTSYKLLFM